MFEKIVNTFNDRMRGKTSWSNRALKDLAAEVIGDVSMTEQWASPILFGLLLKELQTALDAKTGWGRNQAIEAVMLACIRIADRSLKDCEKTSLSMRNIIP